MQHIENLQHEDEAMRKQMNDEHARWQEHKARHRAEVEAKSEHLRKETLEFRQRLEESLRQQEQLRKCNEDLHTWMRDRGHFHDHNIVNRCVDQEEGHPFARRIMEELIPPHFIIPKFHRSLGRATLKPISKLSELRC